MTEQLGDVNHTNPYTDKPFGDTQTYGRGKFVAADGGEAEAVDADDNDDNDAVSTDGGAADKLGNIDHTPPEDAPSANAAYDRTDGNGV